MEHIPCRRCGFCPNYLESPLLCRFLLRVALGVREISYRTCGRLHGNRQPYDVFAVKLRRTLLGALSTA